MENKFLFRSDEDYHEVDLNFCRGQIKYFRSRYFRKNSKYPARIYVKTFHPPDCPPQFYMRYIVFEVNEKAIYNYPITPEAFDTLTKGIEPTSYQFVDFYILEKFSK